MAGSFAAADARRRALEKARLAPPLVRLWDGSWGYIGTVGDAISGTVTWKLNDTGSAQLVLRASDPVGRVVMDIWGRQTSRNIHLTVDKDGARWGGRLESASLVKDNSGQETIELSFLSDYEELKHVLCWPNPFLPALVQFPRTHIIMGPTAWVLKQFLVLNLARIQRSGFNIDDLLAPGSHQADWPIAVKPGRASDDRSPWTIVGSRMKVWHDLAAPKLLDSQLTVTCRRWLNGDPEPWPGGRVRHGALVVDIVDKGGLYTDATVSAGSVFGGLRALGRALNEISSDWGARSEGMDALAAYRDSTDQGTKPGYPFVVYREGRLTGIEASKFTWQPARDSQIVVGGHSPYGVNELMSTLTILIGNYVGLMLALPSLGSIIDTLLKPLFADTIAAWMMVRSEQRKQQLGWSRYLERFQEGANTAYSLSAMAAIREGFQETCEKLSCELSIGDGAPWFVGDNGQGNFFLGDRIGAQIKGLPADQLVVQAVTGLEYSWARDSVGWKITVGDNSVHRSAIENVVSKVRDTAAIVHELGVI